jgi:hypothetical protein
MPAGVNNRGYKIAAISGRARSLRHFLPFIRSVWNLWLGSLSEKMCSAVFSSLLLFWLTRGMRAQIAFLWFDMPPFWSSLRWG